MHPRKVLQIVEACLLLNQICSFGFAVDLICLWVLGLGQFQEFGIHDLLCSLHSLLEFLSKNL